MGQAGAARARLAAAQERAGDDERLADVLATAEKNLTQYVSGLEALAGAVCGFDGQKTGKASNPGLLNAYIWNSWSAADNFARCRFVC